MNSRSFGVKLTIAMIVFAVFISVGITITDHYRLKDQASQSKKVQIEENEMMVKYALETIEKAYQLFGNQIAEQMKDKSLILLDKYESEPMFDEWDFAQLKEEFGMDIYIINRDNVIIQSSFTSDIGLDFTKCCGKLVPILNERRSTGEFYHDGIDTEQNTGLLKKYSYIGTRDKKFIIQLGYSIENNEIYNEFNFLDSINLFVEGSDSLYEINVLNIGGNRLGEPVSEERKLSPERRQTFEHTLKTGETQEYRGRWNGEDVIYRYVYYDSDYDTGSTKRKIIEIVYSEQDLFDILNSNRKEFFIQLAAVLIITVAMSLLISRWVSRPMYLAFHDSLTGLKNRAAFDEALESAIIRNIGTTGLLMIDLDNFKQVNDQLGHDIGDQLLRSVAGTIQETIRKTDIAIRLGGDEFVVIMPMTTREEADNVASRLIEEILASSKIGSSFKGISVSVSIGISLSPIGGIEPDQLTKQADTALYRSKQAGKNQYQFYN